MPPPFTHIKIANKNILINTTITTLGIIFESDLTFDKHISSITKQCNYKIFKIKQIKHFLSQTSLKYSHLHSTFYLNLTTATHF